MKKIILFTATLLLFFNQNIISQKQIVRKDIEVHFKGDSQIEVGNHYVGVEFHHSFPVPQRISFYYPVANSIDLSTDYWKRDSTFIMALGLKEDNKNIEWLNSESFEYDLTPYSVSFFKSDSAKSIKITYEFCNDNPAMVLTIELKNISKKDKDFSFYTDLETSLKTSHTYNFKNKAWTSFDKENNSLITNFEDSETQFTRIFVCNAAVAPLNYSGKSNVKDFNNKNWWKYADYYLNGDVNSKNNLDVPAARFLYKKTLVPNESMKIVQIIGSAKKGEAVELIDDLKNNFKKEINEYEDYVLEEVNKNLFLTGDKVLDKTIVWSRAMLAVNQHYIDGSIQPMPCPAEYNFYFTHDVLLTDLAAVNFDLERVKNNLQFIIDHADQNKIIPHAYYWKDSTFKTEYATPDNWNHFWFTILSASYLKHSDDKSFLEILYPYIQKSISETLKE